MGNPSRLISLSLPPPPLLPQLRPPYFWAAPRAAPWAEGRAPATCFSAPFLQASRQGHKGDWTGLSPGQPLTPLPPHGRYRQSGRQTGLAARAAGRAAGLLVPLSPVSVGRQSGPCEGQLGSRLHSRRRPRPSLLVSGRPVRAKKLPRQSSHWRSRRPKGRPLGPSLPSVTGGLGGLSREPFVGASGGRHRAVTPYGSAGTGR